MKKLACLVVLLVTVSSHAAVFFVVIADFSDGSYYQATYVTEGHPDAPCYTHVTYGPEWCTSASNCLARQYPPQPRCRVMPDYPIEP